MAITIGDLAKLTGLTVRTLHYYDEIGLCSPSERTAAGYRLYTDAEVLRLQQILVYRELGLPLDEIAAALAEDVGRDELLRRHRTALVAKRDRIDRMLAALDVAIGAPEDLARLFDGFDPAAYEAEVQERWGETDAYKESARRTKTYGKADWEQIKREADSITTRLVALMRAGSAPSDPAVQSVLADHRAHITRWFYPCTPAMQQGFGEMYVADPRFTANIDRSAPGLAAFWRDAARALPD